MKSTHVSAFKLNPPKKENLNFLVRKIDHICTPKGESLSFAVQHFWLSV